ncbi:hypothetical protein [Neisseria sicca]|uniref:hypothetical protein n=1 Tax=Neisseria sicca TaxID=490 RepID=UPI003FA0BA39
MVKLQAPVGFTDVSFGSQSYTVGEDRIVEVPAEAAQFLYQFGFGNVATEAVETEEPEKAETKRGRKAKTEQAAEAVEPVEAEQAETEQPAEPEKAE